MSQKHNIQIVILAAGKGKRMNGDLPKALMPLRGKPMIEHLLGKIEGLPFGKPNIIVGNGKELVISTLGENKYNYIEQKEQLGTGHAVLSAKNSIENTAESIVILYGDHPFVSANTIKELINKQVGTGKKIAMATVKVADFKDWRSNFLGYSRVIRDRNGKILKTVENKDATDENKKILEVNPCYFCFDANFLWQELDKLKNDNAQKEYYLTDVLKSAVEQGIEIESVEIDPKEALGANSKEELEMLESLVVES